MSRGVSLAGMSIHGYEYYDIHTRPVNMWVSKIPVPTGSGYPFFTRGGFYLRIPTGTNFVNIPNCNLK